jgi:hypothetical protein
MATELRKVAVGSLPTADIKSRTKGIPDKKEKKKEHQTDHQFNTDGGKDPLQAWNYPLVGLKM